MTQSTHALWSADTDPKLRNLAINTIRVIGAEAVNKADSGHPGIVMGAAPMAYALWTDHMRFDPDDHSWENRDRFVLSAGHGSMLIYMLLHLYTGSVSMDEIKEFRQWGGRTAGHPEYHMIPEIEATTGPLGQGLANAVGMAMAEQHLGAMLNTDAHTVVDHYTYVIAGDGCMMEGITNEASSLAGTQGLGKLIVLYDDNNVTIDGTTDIAFTEDVLARYEALGWDTCRIADGTDVDRISQAIADARAVTDKPSLIAVKTVIGYGSPNQGTSKVHGAPLGIEGLDAARLVYEWPSEVEPFTVPEEVVAHFEEIKDVKRAQVKEQRELWKNYVDASPDKAELVQQLTDEAIAEAADTLLHDEAFWDFGEKPQATRGTGGKALNRIAEVLPGLFGGSADLASSNKTTLTDKGYFSPNDRAGQNIHFGVREHAMGAAVNGIMYHGGLLGYGATFFTFLDYMKPAVRLAALSEIPSLFIFTHDSIGVGEDGPTHQPIEHLTMLRSMPNQETWRPADGRETAAAYIAWLQNRKLPTTTVLSRQDLPQIEGTGPDALKGAYVLGEATDADVVLIATGSEVALAVEARDALKADGITARVVSMPSMERFEKQEPAYKDSVLPKGVKRFAIEAGSSLPWYKYVGQEGAILGIDRFGASAKAEDIFENYGFTAANVVAQVKDLLG